ncbi:YciI family protein, partial [Pseudomonas syringae]|uniref:YciI family protein n=1 Tax=Pseudomonas syringae TaxID=317 RepID=UPI0034D9809E
LKQLQAEGRMVLAGPHPAIESNDPGEAGFTGSLIVAEFPTQAEARAWADADPYVAAGVYDSVVIKPFKQVLP